MTFTGMSLDLARLVDCCFAVTAPAPVLPIGQALVVEMGAEPVVVAEEARPLYHAALAHGANHLVTLVAESLDLLAAAGVQPADRVLAPLLSAALDNALRQGDGALTGPVARGTPVPSPPTSRRSAPAASRERSRPTGGSPATPRTAPSPPVVCVPRRRSRCSRRWPTTLRRSTGSRCPGATDRRRRQ